MPTPLDDRIRRALSRGHLIDITTTGKRTGLPRRVELVFHNIDGRVYISGLPGRRSWYANLVANPRFTFHLKRVVQADLPATARPITESAERRAIMTQVARNWDRRDLEVMMAHSPLVEVVFDQPA
jgi:deazaflavin-dependent oxidoreductase (nitroreductase family)